MFFSNQKPEGAGYKGGSDKNLSEINTIVRPILNAIGFDCKKNTLDNSSNKMRIFYKSHPKRHILAQIIVVENLKSIDSRANSNIPESLVNQTTEDVRMSVHLDMLKEHEVYLFLFIKQGEWYNLFQYGDIPIDHYQLTYRGRPDRKNRMWIPAEYLPKFRRKHMLEKELKSILNIK